MLVVLLKNEKDFKELLHIDLDLHKILSSIFKKIVYIIKSNKNHIVEEDLFIKIFTNNVIDMINIIMKEFIISDKYDYLNLINIYDDNIYLQNKIIKEYIKSKYTNLNENILPSNNYVDYECISNNNSEKINSIKYQVNHIRIEKDILKLIGGIDTYSNLQILIEKSNREENGIVIPSYSSHMINDINTALLYFIIKIKLFYEYADIFKLNEINFKNIEKLENEIESNRAKLNLNVLIRENKNKEIDDLFFVIKSNKNENDDIMYDDEIFMFMELLKHRKYYYDCLTKIKKIIELNIHKEEFDNNKLKTAFISFYSTIFNNNLNINELIYKNEYNLISQYLNK